MNLFKEKVMTQLTVDCGVSNEGSRERIFAIIEQFNESRMKATERLMLGREYLMTTQAKDITAEDALEAFGWNRNGFEIF